MVGSDPFGAITIGSETRAGSAQAGAVALAKNTAAPSPIAHATEIVGDDMRDVLRIF